MYTELRQKIKLLRLHLATTRNLLTTQHKLKVEIIGFVRHSEEQLHQTLHQENSSADTIHRLREKLTEDQSLHADCTILIQEFRKEIKLTNKRIERAKLKLHHILFPRNTYRFFNPKNDDDQSSSFSHQSAKNFTI